MNYKLLVKPLCLLFIFTLCRTNVYPQAMTQNTLFGDGRLLNYWLYSPENTEADVLLVYLHGGSGKGDDLNILLNNGFPKYLYEGKLGNIDAYILIPQVPSGVTGWANISTTVKDLIVDIADTYSINMSKISITGHSMGGTGTWSMALRYPEMFSKIAPLSGSINLTDENLGKLSGCNIWAVVGSADEIVDPQASVKFIEALNAVGNESKISVLEGYTHFDVPDVYLDKNFGLTDWLLDYRESGIPNVTVDSEGTDSSYYDLLGRKIANPAKGFFIHHKKVILLR